MRYNDAQKPLISSRLQEDGVAIRTIEVMWEIKDN